MHTVVNSVSPRLEYFGNQVRAASWKAEPSLARRATFEDLVRTGVQVYDFIGALESAWVDAVHAGAESFDAETDEGFNDARRKWLERSRRVLAAAQQLERGSAPILSVAALRERVKRCEFLLSPVEALHTKSPALAKLRTAARRRLVPEASRGKR